MANREPDRRRTTPASVAEARLYILAPTGRALEAATRHEC